MLSENAKGLEIAISFLENTLMEIAKTGLIHPLYFILAARQIPGYDKEQASGIENQIFDTHGFPTKEK